MARAVVIGGGPAGSAAAFHLARAGWGVCVVERCEFPRVKVCGEFVSPAATALLEAIIPGNELAALGAQRVGSFALECGQTASAWRLPQSAWSISRAALDTALLGKARDASAVLVQPASARGVRYLDDRVVVQLADGRSFEADLVIHADGSGRHDPLGPVGTDPRLIGLKCHLRAGLGVDGVRIRACRGAYVGTIQVERGRATCALAAHKALLAAAGGDCDALLQGLWPGFRREWREGDWKSCGVARSGCVGSGHPRSFRIGNAAAAVDPIGGEGIGLALWAGTGLATMLAEGERHIGQPEFLVSVQRRIARRYALRLRTRLPACRAAAELLMHAGLVRAAWPLVRLPGLFVRPWYGLTGKPLLAASR